MPENVQKRLGEVVSIEILQRLSKDGICVILQSGKHEFRFIPKDSVQIDLVKIATILVESKCSDETIENILSKIEEQSNV